MFDNAENDFSTDRLYSLSLKKYTEEELTKNNIGNAKGEFTERFGLSLPENIYVYSAQVNPVEPNDAANDTQNEKHNITFYKNSGYYFTAKDTPDTLIPIKTSGTSLIFEHSNEKTGNLGEEVPAPIGAAYFTVPMIPAAPNSLSELWYGTHLVSKGNDMAEWNKWIKEKGITAEFRLLNMAYDKTSATLGYVSNDYLQPISDKAFAPVRPDTSFAEPESQVDWSSKMLEKKLSGIDTGISVATLAALQIIPHILFFLLLLLIGLSLIAGFKPFKIFCHNHFDIYSFLTNGRQTVDTINTFKMTLSLTVAIAVLGLFQNGTIMEIINWFVRAVTGIAQR
jgi:hypothetical protein